MSLSVSSTFSSRSSIVSTIFMKLLICFELVFVYCRSQDGLFHYFVYGFSFFEEVADCWICFGYLCQRSVGIDEWTNICDLCSVSLIYMSFLMQTLGCLVKIILECILSLVLHYFQICSLCSNLIFCLRILCIYAIF